LNDYGSPTTVLKNADFEKSLQQLELHLLNFSDEETGIVEWNEWKLA